MISTVSLSREDLVRWAAEPYGAVLGGSESGDWTVAVRRPSRILRYQSGKGLYWDGLRWIEKKGDPLEILRACLREVPEPKDAPPFWGGAVGYLAYDLAWDLESLPRCAEADLDLPAMIWAWYESGIAIEHATGRTMIWGDAEPLAGSGDGDEAFAVGLPEADFSREDYLRAISRIQEHIAAGDTYQVNLSQRFRIPFEGNPAALYRRLMAQNPAPFAAYLQYPDFTVVSASPERFLRLTDRRVMTQPIKGTRPRGRTEQHDLGLARELASSAKDRAEHVMIVDLERNDLGKVCRTGSVRVDDLLRLEAHPTVWHLVSTVEGLLAEGCDAIDLLRAAFPGGSITGAPKRRSMEIIESVEPVRRGLYTGSIGYLTPDGAMDLNIVIRTLIVKDGTAYLQVGGGIVADSDPNAEYRETLDKASALFHALGCEPCVFA